MAGKAKKYKEQDGRGMEFYDLPQKHSRQEYKKVLDYVAGMFYGRSGVAGIGTWGSISSPGISDLDICIIADDNCGKLPIHLRSFHFLGAGMKYIITHPFIVAGKNTIRMLQHIYPDNDFASVRGDKIRIEDLGKKEKEAARICLLNDLAVRHYPRDFLLPLFSGKASARVSLLRLNSLCRTLLVCKGLGMKLKKSHAGFMRDVKLLRKKWFEMDDSRLGKLGRLMHEGASISIEVVGFAGSLLERMEPEAQNKLRNFSYLGRKNETYFLREWAEKASIEKSRMEFRKTGKIAAFLPLSLGVQLLQYAQAAHEAEDSRKPGSRHLISAYIRMHIHGGSLKDAALQAIGTARPAKNGSNALQLARKRRIRLLDEQAYIAETMLHSHFPAFFDFGFRPEKGIVNRLQNFALKIRRR